VKLGIGVEPNGTPHFGTLTAISVAFSLAEKLKEAGKKVTVVIDLIDIGEASSIEIEGIKYQKSLAYTGIINDYLHEFREILEKFRSCSGVNFEIVTQKNFNSHQEFPKIIKKIISKREKIEPLLSPNLESMSLRLRVPCPKCGLTDVFGKKNVYENDIILFFCPEHGEHSVDINKDPYSLEFNVSLRFLVRCLIRQEDNKNIIIPYDWVMVYGSDYAGFYQEQI
jgi:lysyl-tRNA synthetase class I